MDPIAFQAGNIIVGNSLGREGLEIVVPPTGGGTKFAAIFHVQASIAVTGAQSVVTIDGECVPMWGRLAVPAGTKLSIGGPMPEENSSQTGGGLRAYLNISGGFPGVPEYLGSKSTSIGIGGYQVMIFRLR